MSFFVALTGRYPCPSTNVQGLMAFGTSSGDLFLTRGGQRRGRRFEFTVSTDGPI